MKPIDPQISIRAARLEDATALSELLAELGFPTPAAITAERLDAMARASELVFVAVRDETVLGLVTVHITPVLHRSAPVGRLTALVVYQCARRQGIGQALVEAAEAALASEGCELVEVTSNKQLTDAHAFYERLGYDATSLRFQKSLTVRD